MRLNLLQQIANEETWETRTRWTGYSEDWWD